MDIKNDLVGLIERKEVRDKVDRVSTFILLWGPSYFFQFNYLKSKNIVIYMPYNEAIRRQLDGRKKYLVLARATVSADGRWINAKKIDNLLSLLQ